MKVPAAPSGEATAEPAYGSLMYRLYRRLLGLILRGRFAFITVLVLLLIGAVQVLGSVRTEFFPLGDRNQFLIYLDFEAGTDVRAVNTQVRRLTGWLTDKETNPEVASHVAYVGHGGPRFFLALSPVDPDPHRAFVLVNTASSHDVAKLIDRTNVFLDESLPAARSDAKRMWFGSTEPGQIKIRLIGFNGDVLAAEAAKLINAFHAVPGTVGIKHDWENKLLKLIVDVDQVRARRAGVSSTDIANSLEATFAGLTVSDYREGDTILPIIVRGEESLRTSLSGLQRVQVFSATNDSAVQLAQVAQLKGEWQFGRIKRRDQERTLTVEARNAHIPAARLLAQVMPTLGSTRPTRELPVGNRW